VGIGLPVRGEQQAEIVLLWVCAVWMLIVFVRLAVIMLVILGSGFTVRIHWNDKDREPSNVVHSEGLGHKLELLVCGC